MQGLKRLLALLICLMLPAASYGWSADIAFGERADKRRASVAAPALIGAASEAPTVQPDKREASGKPSGAARRHTALFAISLLCALTLLTKRRFLFSPETQDKTADGHVQPYIGRAPPHIMVC